MAIVGYWRMNGNSNDASGNGYNGNDTNITYSQTNGILNKGAGLNGISSYIRILNFNSFNPTEYTYSLFLKYNGDGVSNKIYWTVINREVNSGQFYNCQVHILIYSSNKYIGVGWGNGTIQKNISGSEKSYVNDSKWHYITFTHDGTYGTLYFDTILIDKQELSFIRNNTFISDIGYWNQYENYAKISLDELKINGNVWPSAKIKNEYSRIKGFF